MDPIRDASTVLFPLNRFYETERWSLPRTILLRGDALPEPYRAILDHDRDMTPTLEAFFRDTIAIDIIHRGQQGDAYTREVVLYTGQARKPVAYGSINIHLDNMDGAARADVVAGCMPFGSILHKHGIPHVSAPSGFFEIESDAQTQKHFGLREPTRLYGRRNRLSLADDRVLAEVLEILAPIESIQSRARD